MTTNASLAHWSASVSSLPWTVLEKPLSGGFFHRFLKSWGDSNAATFDVTSPSTTVVCLGTKRSGLKSPELVVVFQEVGVNV